MRGLRIFLGTAIGIAFCACKPATSGGGNSSDTQQTTTSWVRGNQRLTPADIQEFFEIVKEFYFNRVQSDGFFVSSKFESQFMLKFGVNPESKINALQFTRNMFDFLESGQFSVTLHGIPRNGRSNAIPPKGMTSRDLQDFLQIVKTEYFKYIASVKPNNFSRRELEFYTRMQGLAPNATPQQGELLIIAGDIFEKIETGR